VPSEPRLSSGGGNCQKNDFSWREKHGYSRAGGFQQRRKIRPGKKKNKELMTRKVNVSMGKGPNVSTCKEQPRKRGVLVNDRQGPKKLGSVSFGG